MMIVGILVCLIIALSAGLWFGGDSTSFRRDMAALQQQLVSLNGMKTKLTNDLRSKTEDCEILKRQLQFALQERDSARKLMETYKRMDSERHQMVQEISDQLHQFDVRSKSAFFIEGSIAQLNTENADTVKNL